MKNCFTKCLITLCASVQLIACGGLQEEQEGSNPNLGSVTVSWTPPVARSNGDPLLLSEIGGYRVYYGLEAGGEYPNRIEVNDSTAQQVTVQAVRGFYFFVVTAIDTAGRESAFSEELAKTI